MTDTHTYVHTLTATAYSTGTWQNIPVTVTYHTADPYAIHLAFPCHGTAWVFARDLLIAGMHGTAGEGDVLIERTTTAGVQVTLRSPYGRLALMFRVDDLQAVLTATTRLVPVGTERMEINWGALGGAR